MNFDLKAFLDQFDTGNVYNPKDMILILRKLDNQPFHIVADLLEAQDDQIKELSHKLKMLTNRRNVPRQLRRK